MKSKSKGGLCLKALLLLTVAIIVVLLLLPKKVMSVKEAETPLITHATTTEVVAPTISQSVVKPSIKEIPQVLSAISWCESRDDQSKVGYNYRYKTVTDENGATSSVKYLWSRDIGKYQINDYYHAETAKKLGFDIYTVEGNTQYAILLYNSNGTRDWNASKPCWSNIETYRAREQSYY